MLKRIYIEIGNICNLQCAFCPGVKRKKQVMSPVAFEHILKEIQPHTSFIYLHIQGEPLYHPEFTKILDLCDAYGMQVQLVTNGTLLNKYKETLLSHKSIRKVSFSLQSVEYHKQDIRQYTECILSFCKEAAKRSRPYCEIRLWRSDNYHLERTQYILDYLRALGKENHLPENNTQLFPHTFISYANEFDWPNGTHTASRTGYCHGGVHQLGILADGTVVPCCLDADGNVDLGNIFETGFDKILSCDRYQNLVNGFRNRIVVEPFCQTCSFRHRFD